MLTNAAVKAARPKSRAYKMFDERGLHLFIAPTGLKAWRLKCRVQGREKLLSLGRYPEISLAEAREGADRTREAIAAARDPSVAPAADFETVARDWHAHRRPRWSDRHASDVLTSLERDVFSALGGKPLGAIDPVAVLTLIQSIEARGARETARRVRQRLDNIFAFAIARMLTDRNPAAAIAGELTAGEAGQRRHPALLDLDEARGLITAAELLPAPAIVRQASLFLALTAVRMTSLLSATWAEIEHLDEAAPLWRIPAAHMKLRKAKKADQSNDHIVPLSPAAASLLREIRGGADRNGHDTHSPIFPIAAGAIGALYRRTAYSGRHVPHGWRASFSTILNEHCPQDRAIIDRALAHVPKDKVEAAYNRAEHLDRRRDLFHRWAELLLS